MAARRDMYIKEVTWSNKNRSQFRYIARETSGETFDPAEGSRVFFAYSRSAFKGSDKLIGVASYTPATAKELDPNDTTFDSSYYHVLTFLFMLPYYQAQGRGTYLLNEVEKNIRSRVKRPIRIQSAQKAVRFFQKHGYVCVGEPIVCACGGSPLFATLYNMEKQVTVESKTPYWVHKKQEHSKNPYWVKTAHKS